MGGEREREIEELNARLKGLYWHMLIIAQRAHQKEVREIAEKAIQRDKELRGE